MVTQNQLLDLLYLNIFMVGIFYAFRPYQVHCLAEVTEIFVRANNNTQQYSTQISA